MAVLAALGRGPAGAAAPRWAGGGAGGRARAARGRVRGVVEAASALLARPPDSRCCGSTRRDVGRARRVRRGHPGGRPGPGRGDSLAARVRNGRGPTRVDDFAGIDARGVRAGSGVRAAVAVPVVIEGRPWGLLAATSGDAPLPEGTEQPPDRARRGRGRGRLGGAGVEHAARPGRGAGGPAPTGRARGARGVGPRGARRPRSRGLVAGGRGLRHGPEVRARRVHADRGAGGRTGELRGGYARVGRR